MFNGSGLSITKTILLLPKARQNGMKRPHRGLVKRHGRPGKRTELARAKDKRSKNLHLTGGGLAGVLLFTLHVITACDTNSSRNLSTPGDWTDSIFNAGLTIADFEYNHPDSKKETVTAAVWYPTQEEPQPYIYYKVDLFQQTRTRRVQRLPCYCR